MTGNKKLLLSIVSNEFASHRQFHAADVERPTLHVAVQENFIVTGGSTLEKLDDWLTETHSPPSPSKRDLVCRGRDGGWTLAGSFTDDHREAR